MPRDKDTTPKTLRDLLAEAEERDRVSVFTLADVEAAFPSVDFLAQAIRAAELGDKYATEDAPWEGQDEFHREMWLEDAEVVREKALSELLTRLEGQRHD